MDNNNVPIGAIQEILGHENRSTTDIYLHTLSGAARNAIDMYEQARSNGSRPFSLDSHSNPHSAFSKKSEGHTEDGATL